MLGKNPTCFICFDIINISNFAKVKSLRKFGECLVDNIFLFDSRFSFLFFFFNLIQAAMEFFQINIMVGLVGSDICNDIIIFNLKLWRKYFCKIVIYDMLWMFFIK